MSSIETAPRTPEAHESEPTLEAHLDALSVDAGRHDLAVVAEDLRAQRVIQETFPPEKRATASMEVREESRQTTDRLRKLQIAATLAMTLISLQPKEGRAEEGNPITAESLIENPKRLEEILEGEVMILQRELSTADVRPEATEMHEEVNTVLRRVQDEHARTGKYGTLALKVGEIGMRALVSTIGGAGVVACYDIIKEIAKAARERRA